ncbi:MAG: metal-dependent transcriptional regulator [Clostridiales bacterium]|nr:metal-dependent transcriptional regulator [Clostridiales bacterium]
MKIQESAENYLECILMLQQQQGQVRSIDIVNRMGFSKPSISIAMKQLREGNYIDMDENNLITLTEAGREIAERIFERHQTLANMLIRLGVGEETAFEDACKLEHDLSEESFMAIKNLYLKHIAD